MKIQQHDGVVDDAAVTAAGLRRASARGRGVAGEREAPRLQGCGCPPSPLYIGPLGGCASPRRWDLLGGRRPRGGVPPKASGGAPSPRVPNPRRMGGPRGGAPAHYGLVPLPTLAHGALRDGWPHPVDPRDPSGGPSTISVTPETLPMAETALPIYNSSPPDHSGTLRDVRDSEQHSVCCILIFIQP